MRSPSDKRPLPPESPFATGGKRAARGLALVERIVSGVDRFLPGHGSRNEPHLAVDNPLRDARGATDYLLGRVDAQPGEVIADIGAGLGYLTVRLSRAVGPEGRIIATEADSILLLRLSRYCGEHAIGNVVPRLATKSRTGFKTIVDKALMINVYTFRTRRHARRYLEKLSRVVRPGGRVFILQDKFGFEGEGVIGPVDLAESVGSSFLLEEQVPLREGALPARGTDPVRGYLLVLRRPGLDAPASRTTVPEARR